MNHVFYSRIVEKALTWVLTKCPIPLSVEHLGVCFSLPLDGCSYLAVLSGLQGTFGSIPGTLEPLICRLFMAGILFCRFWKPIRDGHSDIVHSQLKVFIPASWDYTQVFGDLGVAISVQIMGVFKGKKTSPGISISNCNGELLRSKQFNKS